MVQPGVVHIARSAVFRLADLVLWPAVSHAFLYEGSARERIGRGWRGRKLSALPAAKHQCTIVGGNSPLAERVPNSSDTGCILAGLLPFPCSRNGFQLALCLSSHAFYQYPGCNRRYYDF